MGAAYLPSDLFWHCGDVQCWPAGWMALQAMHSWTSKSEGEWWERRRGPSIRRQTVELAEEAQAYHKLGGVAVDAVVVDLLVVAVTAHEEAAAAGREELAVAPVMLAAEGRRCGAALAPAVGPTAARGPLRLRGVDQGG